MPYVQKNHPFPVTSCGRRRSFTTTGSPIKMYNNSPMLKTAPGKKFSVESEGRTISYGEKGYKIAKCGTPRAHAYCARSSGIKPCDNPPCPNDLSRKKWKCQGKRSVC
tara:strand:- start:63 stop:386 length:324 start_codon:yes stop_codon:yes gene_type:complete